MPLGLFRISHVANEIGTDAGGVACAGVGSFCAETLIVCTHTGPTASAPIDVGIDLFTAAGALVPPGAGVVSEVACGLPAGNTASFITTGAPLFPPYILASVLLASGPVGALGSLRVLSTNPDRTACDVGLLDTTAIGAGALPGPAVLKDVTVTRRASKQKGD